MALVLLRHAPKRYANGCGVYGEPRLDPPLCKAVSEEDEMKVYKSCIFRMDETFKKMGIPFNIETSEVMFEASPYQRTFDTALKLRDCFYGGLVRGGISVNVEAREYLGNQKYPPSIDDFNKTTVMLASGDGIFKLSPVLEYGHLETKQEMTKRGLRLVKSFFEKKIEPSEITIIVTHGFLIERIYNSLHKYTHGVNQQFSPATLSGIIVSKNDSDIFSMNKF